MMYRRIMLACSLWVVWSVPSSAKYRRDAGLGIAGRHLRHPPVGLAPLDVAPLPPVVAGAADHQHHHAREERDANPKGIPHAVSTVVRDGVTGVARIQVEGQGLG